MNRWGVIRVLLIVAYRVIVKRDYLGLLRDLLPKEPDTPNVPFQTKGGEMKFDPMTRKMVRR